MFCFSEWEWLATQSTPPPLIRALRARLIHHIVYSLENVDFDLDHLTHHVLLIENPDRILDHLIKIGKS